MVQSSDGPELNQFKDSHGSKKDSGIRAGSVRHVLEDFVVVINRTKPVKRPVFRDSDSDHIGDGNQAAIAVILMIAGVGGIGAIVAHDEHAALGHGYREREGARVHAGANVGGLIDGHAVDGHRLARALAFDHVTGQADQSLDEVPARAGFEPTIPA